MENHLFMQHGMYAMHDYVNLQIFSTFFNYSYAI